MAKEEEAKKDAEDTGVTEDSLMKALDSFESIVKGCSTGEEAAEEEAGEKKASKKPIKKGFTEKAAEQSDEIAKALEVSDFLKDFASEVGSAMDTMEKSIAKSDELAKSLVKMQLGVADVLKAFGEELKAQRASIDALKAAPATERKSVITKGVERFEEEDTTPAKLTPVTIRKSLEGLVIKGEATAMDMVAYESANYLSPALLGKITKEVMS